MDGVRGERQPARGEEWPLVDWPASAAWGPIFVFTFVDYFSLMPVD